MTGTFERHYPFYFCWIGGVVGLIVQYWVPLNENQSLALVQSLISAAAIISGFVATALTLLLSVDVDTPVIKRLKDAKLYRRLVDFMMHAIYGCVAVVLVSLAMIFLPDANDNQLMTLSPTHPATQPVPLLFWGNCQLITTYLFMFVLGTTTLYSLLALWRIRSPLRSVIDSVHDG